MAANPNYGSCRCDTDDFRLAPKSITYSTDVKKGVNITEFVGDGKIGFDLNTNKRIFVCNEVLVKTQADAELIIQKLQALRTTGTPWKLEWDADGAGDLFKFDGTTASMQVLQVGKEQLSKDNPSAVFVFDTIMFQEASK